MRDPLLDRYVHAVDAAAAERELGALIERHALPLATTIVGRKLRSHTDDWSAGAPDREDVVANAIATLVERLAAERDRGDQPPIEHFVNYMAAVVHSACAHYIRKRYPERARFKNRLRYIFSTDRRLAIWMTSEDTLACGLAEWRGRSTDTDAERSLRADPGIGGVSWARLSRTELAERAVTVARTISGPVDFELLVRVSSAAAGLLEPRDGGDATLVPSGAIAPEIAIDQRRLLTRVWDEVAALPLRQRVALLLNLRDATGAGLLWLLPIAGVATIRQIARVLEFSDAEFAALWGRLPLDDATIGERLGCTRQQVINLRMAARKRLANRTASSASGPQGRKANLTPISDSLRR